MTLAQALAALAAAHAAVVAATAAYFAVPSGVNFTALNATIAVEQAATLAVTHAQNNAVVAVQAGALSKAGIPVVTIFSSVDGATQMSATDAARVLQQFPSMWSATP